VLIALVSVAVAAVAQAQNAAPRDIGDLVGRQMKNVKDDLRNRGYVRIDRTKAGNGNYQQWWNSRTSKCGTLHVQNGRVSSIVEAPPFDCNQDDENRNSNDRGKRSSTAFYANGSSSHRSHHHSEQRHYSENYEEDEFERGYRDALHSQSFRNFNDSDAYLAGYRSGKDQRGHNTSYRQHSGSDEYGYRKAHSNAEIERLSGERASSVDDTLRNWGFQDVDGFSSGNTKYTIWYNWSTGQCLQMTTGDGRAVDVRDIGYNEHCH
jgi:hypothetical protein